MPSNDADRLGASNDRPPLLPASVTHKPAQPLEQPSFWDAIKTLSVGDIRKIHKIPCARDALLVGICAGFAFGGVKFVMRGTISSAANWAVGTFCGTSVVVYEACHLRRYQERAGMRRAVEIMERQKRRAADPVVVRAEDAIAEVGPPAKNTISPGVEGGGSRARMTGATVREDEKLVVDGDKAGKGKHEKNWYRFW